jgi:hypothetical protein
MQNKIPQRSNPPPVPDRLIVDLKNGMCFFSQSIIDGLIIHGFSRKETGFAKIHTSGGPLGRQGPQAHQKKPDSALQHLASEEGDEKVILLFHF